MVISMRLPNLAKMIQGDAIPDRLKHAALAKVQQELTGIMPSLSENGDQPEKPEGGLMFTMDDVAKMVDLHEWLILEAVVDPELDQEDLAELPEDDKAMIVDIANRDRVVDALGKYLGVEPMSRWDTWRTEHGCADDCPECKNVQSRFSTA